MTYSLVAQPLVELLSSLVARLSSDNVVWLALQWQCDRIATGRGSDYAGWFSTRLGGHAPRHETSRAVTRKEPDHKHLGKNRLSSAPDATPSRGSNNVQAWSNSPDRLRNTTKEFKSRNRLLCTYRNTGGTEKLALSLGGSSASQSMTRIDEGQYFSPATENICWFG